MEKVFRKDQRIQGVALVNRIFVVRLKLVESDDLKLKFPLTFLQMIIDQGDILELTWKMAKKMRKASTINATMYENAANVKAMIDNFQDLREVLKLSILSDVRRRRQKSKLRNVNKSQADLKSRYLSKRNRIAKISIKFVKSQRKDKYYF